MPIGNELEVTSVQVRFVAWKAIKGQQVSEEVGTDAKQ